MRSGVNLYLGQFQRNVGAVRVAEALTGTGTICESRTYIIFLAIFYPEQSRYVTEALRHLHAAQTAAADESRASARTLSGQQQVRSLSSS